MATAKDLAAVIQCLPQQHSLCAYPTAPFRKGAAQPFGEFDREIRAAAVTLVDKPDAFGWTLRIESLFEGIETAPHIR